ncbi:MAG: VWA domain-containing protein [Terracidiphilus sp.]
MVLLLPRQALIPLFLLSCAAAAQVLGIPTGMHTLDEVQTAHMDFNMFLIGSRDPHSTSLQTQGGSVSVLDLKAPRKAKREYDKGYRLLMANDPSAAIDHLQKALSIDPKFVSAHNALGTAYLDLGQNDPAKNEFLQAVALDNHLPTSYLNLGCAHLVLKQYPDAEDSFRKASAIAPLDNQLQLALAYAEFENRDFPAVIATTHDVHARKHDGAAVVHFFAAGAWEAQGNFVHAEREMDVLLKEDPKSSYADQFRHILDQIKAEQSRQESLRLHPAVQRVSVQRIQAQPTPEGLARQRRFASQQQNEKNQIAEAEAAPNPVCIDCAATTPDASLPASAPDADAIESENSLPTPTFRVTADEVSVFFAATDHGRSVPDLAASDVALLDDSQPPSAILGFRDESQLPLRLGLVVDISDSVAERLSFEKTAAIRFLQRAVARSNDQAFVVGVDNSVLLLQDFTADPALTTQAVNELAPGGGTALWDAVEFAAGKLAGHAETKPVARMLVVISDGEDNSSSTTLKQAIAAAQRDEVAVYTVSTRDGTLEDDNDLIGDHALQTLSELTGGTALMPGSIRHLDHSLADLQEIIRGRYLISYKPASFARNERYRTIAIEAHKDGRKLTVFARKGYYASAALPNLAPH